MSVRARDGVGEGGSTIGAEGAPGAPNHNERRVFLEVRDAAAVVNDLAGPKGLFVPTRLPLALNSLFVLAVRLRGASRPIELSVIVLGRRVPRGGSLLSAGVIARLADPESAMFALLKDVASGRVVDLEARIQEQVRTPARALFTTTSEAISELRALLDGEAMMPLDQPVQRGDRLALTVSTDEDGVLGTPQVLVKGLSTIDGRRSCAAILLEGQRAALEQCLEQLTSRARTASRR